MPISSHLLDRAYQLINAKQMQNAELVLDAVVRVDPQNIEAWIAYMEIHQDRTDLERLKERILRTREISDQDKKELLQYHAVVNEHLKDIENGTFQKNTHYNLNFNQPKESVTKSDKVSFELLDIFDYSSAKNEPITRRRPVKVRRKSWESTYLSSPVNQAIALLFLFCIAIRVLISGYFIGYGLLGLFLFGCFYWLSNYKHPKQINLSGPARMYFHETKSHLSIKDQAILDAKRKKEQNP